MKYSIWSVLFLIIFYSFPVLSAPKFEADISVDVTAQNVSDAKKQAMKKAVREGVVEVVQNISTAQSVETINKLTDSQLQHFVLGVMVLMEKTSDVRYVADLRISLNEEVLRAYMAENDMPFAVKENVDVLVIPLLEKEDGELDLWSDENQWRLRFAERGNIKKGNLNIFAIKKNLGNIASADGREIYDMNKTVYDELSSFNQVENIYVLKYSLKDKKVYIKSFGQEKADVVDIGDDDYETVMEKTFLFFRSAKKDEIPQDIVADMEKMEVIYSYENLGSWLKLKKMLDDNPLVQNIKVVSMVNKKVHFNMEYNGVLEKLQVALGDKGYKLKKEGEHYVVY